MPMPPYPVICQTPDCGEAAAFKVAAAWSDGVTAELKTFALCCESCLPNWFESAKDRQRACRLVDGETLSEPHIYERGDTLTPRLDLER
jgi:hypothetical protein